LFNCYQLRRFLHVHDDRVPNETFEKEVLAIAYDDAARLPRNSLLANKRSLRAPIRKQLHDAINKNDERLVERFLSGAAKNRCSVCRWLQDLFQAQALKTKTSLFSLWTDGN